MTINISSTDTVTETNDLLHISVWADPLVATARPLDVDGQTPPITRRVRNQTGV